MSHSSFKPIKVGERFGHIVVLERAAPPELRSNGAAYWRVRCDCGVERTTTGTCVRNARLVKGPCGCAKSASDRKRGNQYTVLLKYRDAGIDGTSTYRIWTTMKSRCLNPKFNTYRFYGALGVRVCDRWLESFDNFVADMGMRPKGKWLDRFPNKEGNYEPGNCRWATVIEQQNNKRNNVFITVGLETKTIAQWARDHHINESTLRNRIRAGWHPFKATWTGAIFDIDKSVG